MRIAYLDCSTGISGDMTLAALIDAGVDAAAIRAGIDSLGLPGVRLETSTIVKGGFRATYVRVKHPEQHAHRHLSDIVKLIDGASAVSSRQKDLAKRIFSEVASAEAKVHGSTIDKIHFHEVGAIDSIVDIVGAAIGFDLLGADQVVSSAVPTGRGQVRIAHGVCTVPTPGTAELLKGIPLVDVPVDGELTTPTGAAILRTVVDRFAPLPGMSIEAIGYGAGTMELPGRANLLRLIVGSASADPETDVVTVLETNLDDVAGEIVGYAKRRLLEEGALDVFTVPIQMKKDRPGTLLTVLCRMPDADRLEEIVFRETGTFGVRRSVVQRTKRVRQEFQVESPWGPVAGKLGWYKAGTPVFTPEFESCARIAAEQGIPLKSVYQAAEAAFASSPAAQAPPPLAAQRDVHHHDHDHDHDHDHGRAHDHDHGHDHDHDHDHHHHDHDHHHHDHDHDHDHGHDHDHDHGR